jgi:hypothetical protein
MKDGDLVCELCSTGYRVDPYGECFDCDVGYSIVTINPFTCATDIYGCAVHISKILNGSVKTAL